MNLPAEACKATDEKTVHTCIRFELEIQVSMKHMPSNLAVAEHRKCKRYAEWWEHDQFAKQRERKAKVKKADQTVIKR